MMYWGSGGETWAVAWMILFWVVILGAVYMIVRAASGTGRGGTSARDARDILSERFARGEISEEEFRDRLRVLDEKVGAGKRT